MPDDSTLRLSAYNACIKARRYKLAAQRVVIFLRTQDFRDLGSEVALSRPTCFPLARTILDFVAEQLPGRSIRSLADGGYATKDSVRLLPKAAYVAAPRAKKLT